MKNLTEYNDQFVLSLIEQANGNPFKCTANVQYAVEGNHLIPMLVIYQDISEGWDYDWKVLFCKRTATVDFLDDMSIEDLNAMVDYYTNVSFQKCVNDIEYEMECEEYERAMLDEIAWYRHARQMGWE